VTLPADIEELRRLSRETGLAHDLAEHCIDLRQKLAVAEARLRAGDAIVQAAIRWQADYRKRIGTDAFFKTTPHFPDVDRDLSLAIDAAVEASHS
jgi:hypothetical protein